MFIATNAKNLPQALHAVGTAQQLPYGTIVQGYDPLTGYGEFMYVQGVASCVSGSRLTYNPSTGVTVLGTAGQNGGLSCGFALAALVASTFGFIQVAGTAVAVNNATAAAGLGMVAASGAITSTAVTGGQLIGGTILVANGTTFTKTCTTRNGSTQLFVPDFGGLFVGLPVSGTGIPGATTIAAGVDGAPNASGNGAGSGYVNLNNAATADGTVTITFTRTNFSLFGGGGRFVQQGQIT